MNNNILLSIGRKIRDIRIQQNQKLINIAEKAGISKGLLSQIENGRTIPSLPVLLQIIKILQTDYADFFEGLENQQTDTYILKRKKDYTHLEKEESEGFNYLSILSECFGNVAIQVNILELQPNAKRERVTTDGYTYLYILQGEIDYLIGNEKVHLTDGDSLFFNATIPHVPQNNTHQPAKILVLYILSSEKSKKL